MSGDTWCLAHVALSGHENHHPGRAIHCILKKWVRAGFENGVCERISYASSTGFSRADVSSLLSLNSAAVRWIIERRSKEENKVYYRCGDLNYRAVLTNGMVLFIVKEKCFQKGMGEISKSN